ncbi:MAG: type VI secretion system tube protein Hcp [Chitinivibrionales bacterium]|nr:type VI secretion system tube protein Hcp [Chitinivibrionales bacterium]
MGKSTITASKLACLVLAVAVTTSYSALNAYMRVQGQAQGVIEGECTRTGLENWIEVSSVTHLVEIPRDTHTGLPTGQRVHKPLVVRKRTGKSSPKLCQAVVTGEHCVVEIRLFRMSEAGSEEHYYTVKLEDAIIVDYHPQTLSDDTVLHEEVAFTYSKITWTYEPDGIQTVDDWKEPM